MANHAEFPPIPNGKGHKAVKPSWPVEKPIEKGKASTFRLKPVVLEPFVEGVAKGDPLDLMVKVAKETSMTTSEKLAELEKEKEFLQKELDRYSSEVIAKKTEKAAGDEVLRHLELLQEFLELPKMGAFYLKGLRDGHVEPEEVVSKMSSVLCVEQEEVEQKKEEEETKKEETKKEETKKEEADLFLLNGVDRCKKRNMSCIKCSHGKPDLVYHVVTFPLFIHNPGKNTDIYYENGLIGDVCNEMNANNGVWVNFTTKKWECLKFPKCTKCNRECLADELTYKGRHIMCLDCLICPGGCNGKGILAIAGEVFPCRDCESAKKK